MLANAAREPEVCDLADLLRAMGARISGDGTANDRRSRASRTLHGARHAVVADRIEAGTYALAAALTRGDVTVDGCVPGAPGGADDAAPRRGSRRRNGPAVPARPGGRDPARPRRRDRAASRAFPTDLQAQWMALATSLDGVSTVTETIFENRFQHVPELLRMGARIRLEGRWAIVEGPVAARPGPT